MTPTKSDFLCEIRKRQAAKRKAADNDYSAYRASKSSRCSGRRWIKK